MPTNDWHIYINQAEVLLPRQECVGPDHIQGGHPKELLWVINSLLLEDLSSNWDSGVDRVADNMNEGMGGMVSSCRDEGFYYSSVDVEEVITTHARFSGDTSRDDHKVNAFERAGQLSGASEVDDLTRSVQVAQVGSSSLDIGNVIEMERRD